MPICEADPWRRQYFDAPACPADIRIPTADADAWSWNPAHRHVYDRLELALSQGLEAAPHGVTPGYFPVFSKPIYKLGGSGGGRRLRSPADYAAQRMPGHMWMSLLRGAHVSTDAALVDGSPRWWRHATGIPGTVGGFDHWRVQAAALPGIEQHLAGWVARHLKGYTGMVNFETVAGMIIDVHLRFTDQWPDLYGAGWIAALIELYHRGRWDFADADRRDGYSIELLLPAGLAWPEPAASMVQAVRSAPEITSVQILTPPAQLPGALVRLAVINCRDLAAGLAARDRLYRHVRQLLPPAERRHAKTAASPAEITPSLTTSA
jgi:hypothetical protein